MTGRLVKVRAVRTADGKPSLLPRVSDPADALTAPGWTVYTERGLIPQAALGLARLALLGLRAVVVFAVGLLVKALVFLAGLLAGAAAGSRRLLDVKVPLRRCAGCGLCLRRDGVGLVDLWTGSDSCPVTGVRHAAWVVSGRG